MSCKRKVINSTPCEFPPFDDGEEAEPALSDRSWSNKEDGDFQYGSEKNGDLPYGEDAVTALSDRSLSTYPGYEPIARVELGVFQCDQACGFRTKEWRGRKKLELVGRSLDLLERTLVVDVTSIDKENIGYVHNVLTMYINFDDAANVHDWFDAEEPLYRANCPIANTPANSNVRLSLTFPTQQGCRNLVVKLSPALLERDMTGSDEQPRFSSITTVAQQRSQAFTEVLVGLLVVRPATLSHDDSEQFDIDQVYFEELDTASSNFPPGGAAAGCFLTYPFNDVRNADLPGLIAGQHQELCKLYDQNLDDDVGIDAVPGNELAVSGRDLFRILGTSSDIPEDLVDLVLQGILRATFDDCVYVFPSWFYARVMASGQVEANYNANGYVEPLQLDGTHKIALLPVWVDQHWLLVVIMNPDCIAKKRSDGGDCCCLLLMDSLRHSFHRNKSQVLRTVRSWLLQMHGQTKAHGKTEEGDVYQKAFLGKQDVALLRTPICVLCVLQLLVSNRNCGVRFWREKLLIRVEATTVVLFSATLRLPLPAFATRGLLLTIVGTVT